MWHFMQAGQKGGQYFGWQRKYGQMKPGDCINIPAGVKHWHGAAPDSWFSHLAIEVPGENGRSEWLEPVDDEQYGGLV
jgi:4-carboxymuconolactone decarboxylase